MSSSKMGTRNRVLSFMSKFSDRDSASNSSPSSQTKHESYNPPARAETAREAPTPSNIAPGYNMDGSFQTRNGRERAASTSSRPMSMVQTYQPPLMDVNADTLPELQPIFTFLNSHGNKLYQEGYFLKLDDQNTHGRANADRTWTECFAQLVGTVLSLWDAAELDTAGEDGEVLPKFINLTDASIKMIESLPTRSDNEAPLQNVLSISTAGRNRYLLHFNSHHSLVQWTAGIRLSMFEHATLQEAYTGALIAGKGKALNNIGAILERSKIKHEDWARVRFGAGTPWRRCWCVISPPDEKEVQKLQKQANKKKSAYDKTRGPVLKGDIKFYDTKKTKKMKPIATITDAYSAFALYPQSKPLIDASTLVKLEGSITIHSNPPSSTEGFVFVMPEAHAAVTGFEMMLRWLFPVYDTFSLYGRPGRLIADTQDSQSLMFAMPKHRRYGYLEILDVSGLIVEQGSGSWRESEWRRKMKELTKKRMTAIENGSRTNSRYSSRRSTRNSFGPSKSRTNYDDGASIRSSPSITWSTANPDMQNGNLPRTDSPPIGDTFKHLANTHHRSVSETQGLDRYQNDRPSSAYDGTFENAPTPPPHTVGVIPPHHGSGLRYQNELAGTPERVSSEDEQAARAIPVRELQELQATSTPEPVAAPPAFSHRPGALPISKPYHSPELRRANSRMSNATLTQLAGASGVAAAIAAHGEMPRTNEDHRYQAMGQSGVDRNQAGVPYNAINERGIPANQRGLNEGFVAPNKHRFSIDNPFSRPSDPIPRAEHSQPLPQLDSINSASSTPPGTARPPPPPSHGSTDYTSGTRTYAPPNIFSSPNQSSHERQFSGHQPQTSTDSTSSAGSRSHLPTRLQTSHSIIRKPLPTRTATLKTPSSEEADSPSSMGSLGNHIDLAAFDMIGLDHRTQTLRSEHPSIQRQNSDTSAYGDDNASTASPDYASTHRPSVDSRRSKKSVERPRAGIKKTIGTTESNLIQVENSRRASNIPDIDFGPTINYAAQKLPSRSQNPGPMQSYGDHPRGVSPGPAMNNAMPERKSPTARPGSAGRQLENNIVESHYRNNSGEGRTVPWQPGMAVSGPQAPATQSITAEQFVAQRAAAAIANPMYVHQRQNSSNALGRNTPTPPLVRNRSSDYLAQQGHSRNSSTDILARPSSRGAGEILARPNSRGAGEMLARPSSRNANDILARPNSRAAASALTPSGGLEAGSKLSAREQEHIARVTGQPLISMANNNSRQSGPQPGLVGAIEARENERQQIKQGINSQAVEHVIAMRQQQQQQLYAQQQQQQQAQQMQYQQQMQPGFRHSQSFNTVQFQQPQYPTQGQHQGYAMASQNPHSWGISPAAGVFAQGGGWAAPSPAYAQTPGSGRQSPGQHTQQQYFPPQQGQGQGRGNQGHPR